MGCPTDVIIGNSLVFSICTHDPDTGVLTDADSAPTYRVYEDETAAAILTGSMAKLDDANTTGFYTEQIACTAANGFEDGKSYTVYIEATVDSDKGGISYGFTAHTHVWDEVLTAATHNVGYSSGQRLRYLILTGAAAQAGSTNSITLAATESAIDHIFNENIISIVSGTGIGQTRLIAEYDGTTKVATVDKAWFTTPAAGSIYEILPFSSILVAQHGTVQAATASSITLAAIASAIDDIYVGNTVYISSGAGAGQIRLISDYDGATKIATIVPDWITTPDVTSVYKVLPVGRSIVDSINTDAISADVLATDAITEIAAGVWDRLTSALTTTGSIGKLIVDNLAASGSLAAAVWSYATRTLTQSAASVVSAVAGSVITVTRGDTFSGSLTGLGDISNYTRLWFTIKRNRSDADTASIVQIVLSNPTVATDGLLYLNGAAATASQGSIAVDDAGDGDITITIDEAATAELEPQACVYDVQVLRSTGAVNTLTEAECDVNADVTRATS